ncbi:hypothetical protein RRG08_015466, partial [Elysia crispata]
MARLSVNPTIGLTHQPTVTTAVERPRPAGWLRYSDRVPELNLSQYSSRNVHRCGEVQAPWVLVKRDGLGFP